MEQTTLINALDEKNLEIKILLIFLKPTIREFTTIYITGLIVMKKQKTWRVKYLKKQ
ncbi:hypothetical protein [Clostridium ljungdahlii]|uniref:hypothetical protein n=1 Tax=Clostridium ljungdahlii TaxID=1538 RepID=UPI000AFAFD89